MRVMHKRLVVLADFSSFVFYVGNKDDASINTFSVFYSLDLYIKNGKYWHILAVFCSLYLTTKLG